MATTTFKTAKVIKAYPVKYKGYEIVVPVGAVVANKTACGCDDSYRFWQDWSEQAKTLTGFKDSLLAHDLTHYGLNVPADHCESYPQQGT